MVGLRDLTRLGDDLDRLAGALEGLDLEAEPASLRAERDRLGRTVRSYLVPRARDGEIPLTVVFAGPTGSGKSTLINSLTGLELSVAGPLRPTTTGPVVLARDGLDSGLDSISGIECEVVTGSAPILDSLILVDTPDLDSTSIDHRRIAEALIDGADVVVFVTSALRYADAVPWQVLRRAESRGTEVIHVLNRVSSSTRGAVVDFRARLGAADLEEDVLTVPEHHIAPGAQRLPAASIRPLRTRLASLAVDRIATSEHAFDRVLRTTIDQTSELHGRLLEAEGARRASVEAIADSLSGRHESLDLAPAARGLIEEPTGETRRQVRRWRRSRRGPLTADEVDGIVDALTSLITRDIRLWLAERGWEATLLRIDPGPVVVSVGPIARLAVEGWVDFVRRIAKDEGEAGHRLAEPVLISSATGSMSMSAARILFDDTADDVVGRARRELSGRLRVIYDQVAAHLTELVEMKGAAIDVTELRAALASVSSNLTLVDA